MSARPRQVKSLGKPFLFGCAAVLSLPLKNNGGELAATNDVNRLKPYQAISTNTPPLSPEIFNPDPNAVEWPPLPQTDFRWQQRVIVSSNTPPASPEIFNPDPGASFRPQTNVPPALFIEPPAPPIFTPPPIPPGLALPREGVRLEEFLPPRKPEPGGYGMEPLTNGLALPRWDTRRELKIYPDFGYQKYSLQPGDYPTNTVPQPNRWRIGFVPWERYTSGVTEQPYETPEPLLWAPYHQSVLKGDLPIIGQDIFLDLTASAETVTEFRRVPTASGVSGAVPGEYEFYGEGEELSIQNYLAFEVDLFQGDTAFRPVTWAVDIQPVFNVNYLQAEEAGVVSPSPTGSLANNTPPPANGFVQNPGDIGTLLSGQVGPANSYRGTMSTERTETYFSLQQAFVEFHLLDLSDNYDFMSLRIGNQPFNADFRGFLFNDINLGARLFGNFDNNLYQYNLAGFDMREKDTDSELNTFNSRNQDVLIANLYRQDLLAPGYTGELSFLANFDHGGVHYDDNGFIVRPAPLGTIRPHDVTAYYVGWGGDGHIGRLNVSHQFYQAFGRDDFNGLAGGPVNINAQMGAMEVSYDLNWVRYKASFFYASGDNHTTGGTGSGFDTIVDNPNFTGGPFSFWSRQGFNLGGTLVNLKDADSLVPDLRTSKTEGQANFVNPGVYIFGLGAEFDLTPKLRSFLNANYIRFAETDPIETALLTPNIDRDVGWDLSLGFQYRPLLTDNIIFSAGFGVLIPALGYHQIYDTNPNPIPGFDGSGPAANSGEFPYSGLMAVTLRF
ncbi:MAG TPA: hypothetical protein VMH30_05135 [Verrucomicrobiae bacterium]|nr:hypothetical protein [Verrucomicrobiae bacterium]